MKPRLRTEIIRRQYWACANPNHRHTTEAKAAECMRPRRTKHTWTDEQREEVWRAHHENGETFASIGRRLGLSAAYMSDIAKSVAYKRERAAWFEKNKDRLERAAAERAAHASNSSARPTTDAFALRGPACKATPTERRHDQGATRRSRCSQATPPPPPPDELVATRHRLYQTREALGFAIHALEVAHAQGVKFEHHPSVEDLKRQLTETGGA